jgi:hypothetical protein
VTVDEELTKLEDEIRRLKIEYEVYLNGSSDRPPRDPVYRVETLIKRYTGDQSNLNFGQRYKLNTLGQKYAIQNSLWKRKLMEKEEGRGQFAQQQSRHSSNSNRIVRSVHAKSVSGGDQRQ